MDHGQCLTEDTLTDYLEGGLDRAVTAASEVHLVGCDDCRRRLGFYMRLLSEELTPEESSAIQLVTAEWEKKSQGKLGRRAGTWTNWFFPVTAAAAALALGFVTLNQVTSWDAAPDSPREVVQLLLSQERPFELQMSDQPHLPIVRTRGIDDPGLSYNLVAGELSRLSADSHQMGRFYLLHKDFMRAIGYLELAEKEVGAGVEIHNDLGVAYFEAGGESRLQEAMLEFRHALEIDPSFAPAVFNLAIFHERTGAMPEAESQWRRYLQLDSSSAWSDEANTRLRNLSR
jgi:tetratricopeptide (TPR) repeat protein